MKYILLLLALLVACTDGTKNPECQEAVKDIQHYTDSVAPTILSVSLHETRLINNILYTKFSIIDNHCGVAYTKYLDKELEKPSCIFDFVQGRRW